MFRLPMAYVPIVVIQTCSAAADRSDGNHTYTKSKRFEVNEFKCSQAHRAAIMVGVNRK